MPEYIIHACPQRMWYVEDFLVPSMTEQGIERDQITIWNDAEGRGNLFSFMDSCKAQAGKDGGAWHMQDDAMICHDFAERTREHDDGVVCGFCYSGWEPGIPITGYVYSVLMWVGSFACIRIPHAIAAECAEWFYGDAVNRECFAEWVASRKKDDSFFRAFMVERHRDDKVLNLAPNLVEHVDYIIGGSVINQWRGHTARGYYFEDAYLTEELQKAVTLARR